MPHAVSKSLLWLLLAAVAFPFRFDFSIGPFTTLSVLDLAVITAVVCISIGFLSLSPLYLGPRPLLICVLVPVVTALLSIAWSTDTQLSAAGGIKYCYSALLYLIAMQLGRTIEPTQFGRMVAAVVVCWIAGSAAMYLGIPGFAYFFPESLVLSPSDTAEIMASVYTRLGHPYIGQSNDYGPLLAFSAFVLLGHARLNRSRLLFAAGVLALAAAVLTFSRGLMGGLALAVCVYVIAGGMPVRHMLAGLATVALAIAVGWALVGQNSIEIGGQTMEVTDIVESRLSDVNVRSRVDGYRETMDLVFEQPLSGYGVGYYQRSSTNPLVASHSSLLEQWKYFGLLLGTLTFSCYVGIGVYFFAKRRGAGNREILVHALACAWLCLLVSSLVQTFFEATVPRAMMYFLLGLCVSVYMRRDRSVPAGTAPLDNMVVKGST